MAVEAVASGVMRKLSGLHDIETAMVELRRIQNNAQYQEQINTVPMDRVFGFLGTLYRVEDTIESFCVLDQTHSRRMGFVSKRFSVIANRWRKVPSDDTMENSRNIPGLKSKMKEFRKEIQDWEDRLRGLVLEPLQGSPERPMIVTGIRMETLRREITSDTQSLQIISILGDIGIENATAAETIYTSKAAKDMFPCRARLVMDANSSVEFLILRILQQVVTTPDHRYLIGAEKLKEEDLIAKLVDYLNDKRYLIVINDIRSLDLLKKLRRALPDAENGSRVVITTPDEKTALFAGETSRYHYRPLDTVSGLRYFKKLEIEGIRKGSPLSQEIEDYLKIKIADICRGNPFRIKLLAGFLSTKEINYGDLSSIDKQLDFANKSPSSDIVDICYSDLPPHLNPCFLYLGLFHKGFEIPVRRLSRLWLAEGFLEPISQDSTLEDIVEGYLKELEQRNMVEISKRRSDESPIKCRMAGSLHDTFRTRAVETGLFHLHQKSNENSNAPKKHEFGVRRLIESANIKNYHISKDFSYHLQSYISLNNRKKDMLADDVGNFLTGMIGARWFELLKVLDLEEVDRPQLPDNLGSLFHLRYLGLRYTFLKTLPSSLGSLLHLETLDIKHTQVTILPNSIWRMISLRHLCLNRARLEIPLQKMVHKAPTQLQTLQGLFLDEKIATKIGSTLSRMTNLRKLDLTRESSSTSHSYYEDIDRWISSLSSLRSLRLRSMDTKGHPSVLNIIQDFSKLQNLSQLYLLGHLPKSLDWYKIPSGLKVLTLSVSQLKEDPMLTLSKLKNLVDLRLLASSYVGKAMSFPANGFPSLHVLKLWNLKELEILIVEEGTMQKLHTLEIRCCEKLKKECPETFLKKKVFRKLILTNMPKTFVTAMKIRKEKHFRIQVYPKEKDF